MGVVVAAHHLQLDERVALKFLRPEALESPEAVARFIREARAAVKIKSEHVARVVDVGQLETGAPYMVMEYLEGGDLSAWIAQRGALPIEQAVEFVLQACDAIAEAHAIGIIHRDLKPANLFCVRRTDGLLAVKVLDFGISKITGTGASGRDMGMTRTQALMGSPYYMSPEQMQSSKGVDPRADIWALGVILFELVTGRVPFDGEAIPELVLHIVSAPTPSLRALRPDAPAGLDAVVQRCLEKDRDRRFASVAELAHGLAAFAPRRAVATVERISRVLHGAGLSTTGPTPAPAPSGTGTAPAGTMAPWGRTTPGTTGKTKAVVGVVAAAALASAVAVVSVARRATHTTAAAHAVAEVAPAAPPSAVPSSPPSATPAETPPKVELAPPSAEPPASAPPHAPPASKPAPRPAAAPARPASPAKPTCSAVPYLDSEGNMHFKQVCN
jgi:serine/threonine-protein kinase